MLLWIILPFYNFAVVDLSPLTVCVNCSLKKTLIWLLAVMLDVIPQCKCFTGTVVQQYHTDSTSICVLVGPFFANTRIWPLFATVNRWSTYKTAVAARVTTRASQKNPSMDRENPEKNQDEFNAVTSVLSSTHHGKHQGHDFTRTFAVM